MIPFFFSSFQPSALKFGWQWQLGTMMILGGIYGCFQKYGKTTQIIHLFIGFGTMKYHHPFWGTSIFGNTHICSAKSEVFSCVETQSTRIYKSSPMKIDDHDRESPTFPSWGGLLQDLFSNKTRVVFPIP